MSEEQVGLISDICVLTPIRIIIIMGSFKVFLFSTTRKIHPFCYKPLKVTYF